MADYLQIYEKFKHVKEIEDYISDVNTLRDHFQKQEFIAMQEHIHKLTVKYPLEVFIWNTVNRQKPYTYEQSYINAENFLQLQGAKLLIKTVRGYANYLTKEETEYIQSVTNT